MTLQYQRFYQSKTQGKLTYLKGTLTCVHQEVGTPYPGYTHLSCVLRCYSWQCLGSLGQRQCGDRLVLCPTHIHTQVDYIFYLALQLDVAFEGSWPIAHGEHESFAGSLRSGMETEQWIQGLEMTAPQVGELSPECTCWDIFLYLLPTRLDIRKK